jgi:hypothetical protein
MSGGGWRYVGDGMISASLSLAVEVMVEHGE